MQELLQMNLVALLQNTYRIILQQVIIIVVAMHMMYREAYINLGKLRSIHNPRVEVSTVSLYTSLAHYRPPQ